MIPQKLPVPGHKTEMKHQLAIYTPQIYNSLDLLVGSPEFAQVLFCLFACLLVYLFVCLFVYLFVVFLPRGSCYTCVAFFY